MSRFQAYTRRVALVLLVIYWSAMFLGTHYPSSPSGSSPVNDKVLHTAAYCGLSFLLCWTCLPIRGWKGTLGVISVVAAYGAIDELSQIFVPNRSPDVVDWIADLAGALLGLTIFLVIGYCIREFTSSRGSQRTLVRQDAA